MYSEKDSYLGGMMIVDERGIPIEFKYTDIINPTKLQKVLYGDVLEKYLKEEVIMGNLVEKIENKADIYFVDKLENQVLSKFVNEGVAVIRDSQSKALENIGEFEFVKENEAIIQIDERQSPIRAILEDGRGNELVNKIVALGLEGNIIEPFDRVEEALRLICKGDL
jgi:hypothetical protein